MQTLFSCLLALSSVLTPDGAGVPPGSVLRIHSCLWAAARDGTWANCVKSKSLPAAIQLQAPRKNTFLSEGSEVWGEFNGLIQGSAPQPYDTDTKSFVHAASTAKWCQCWPPRMTHLGEEAVVPGSSPGLVEVGEEDSTGGVGMEAW